MAYAEWPSPIVNECVKINFLDTPGYSTFINDTLETSFKDGSYTKAWKDTAGKYDPADPKIPTVNRY